MNYAPITISEAKNNDKFNSLLSLKNLSFTDITNNDSSEEDSNSSVSNISSSITIVAIPTTLATIYTNSTAITTVSSTIIVNLSRSISLTIC